MQDVLRQQSSLNVLRNLEKAPGSFGQELLKLAIAVFESDADSSDCGVWDVEGLADSVVGSDCIGKVV